MKKISLYPLSIILCLIALVGCSKDSVEFSGGNYVMFSDTLYNMPVTLDAEKTFKVTVSTTTKSDIDRSFAVELLPSRSTAVEGLHFELVSNNVLIKAGELSGDILVKGNYDNIQYGDDMNFRLRILAPKEQIWDLYGKETKVSLIKCIPFDIDKFTGNMKLLATFPYSSTKVFYVKSEKLNDSTLVVKDFLSNKYDLKIRLSTNNVNPFESRVSVQDQIAFVDLGYGQVFARTIDAYPSFYDSHLKAIALYLEMYVPSVGSFNVHRYMLQWVTQAEADAYNNNTGTPFILEGKGAFEMN